jgi:hypothetical protein
MLELIGTAVVCVSLTAVAVMRPAFYGDRLFKILYRCSLIGLVVLLGALFAEVAPNHALLSRLAIALSVVMGVGVVLLPISGKLEGRW